MVFSIETAPFRRSDSASRAGQLCRLSAKLCGCAERSDRAEARDQIQGRRNGAEHEKRVFLKDVPKEASCLARGVSACVSHAPARHG
jgi:hypothetical protein